MRFLPILFGLGFALILSGCGDAKQKAEKVESMAKFESFTNNLQKADSEYLVSFVLTSAEVKNAIDKSKIRFNTEDPEDSQIAAWIGTDMINDQLLLYSNAQNATACISKTDPDFQYIYTHLKDLPPDFKDDFNRMEFLITENQDFVSQLQQRNFTHDLLQKWMNYHAEIDSLYRNILLEVQRCQNMNNQ